MAKTRRGPWDSLKDFLTSGDAGSLSHNSLGGLDGGASGEYYHVDKNTYVGLFSTSDIIGVGDQSGTRISVDMTNDEIESYISSTLMFKLLSSGVEFPEGVVDVGTSGSKNGFIWLYGNSVAGGGIRFHTKSGGALSFFDLNALDDSIFLWDNTGKKYINIIGGAGIELLYAGSKEAETLSGAFNAINGFQIASGQKITSFSTDPTLSLDSDSVISTQKAVKAYMDALAAANDAMVYKGAIDCSTDPNYPAADAGHTYKISADGKIGGASGENVEIGDMVICIQDSSPGGDQAAVGANWNVIQGNVDGAVVGPATSTDNHIVRFDGSTGKLIQSSNGSIDDSGEISGVTNTNWDAAYSHVSSDGKSHSDVVLNNSHRTSTSNPHSVTASQVGAITKLEDDTTPKLGGALEIAGHSILFNPSGLSAGQWEGEVVSATVDTNSIGVGAVLKMASDGHFDQADASVSSTMPCQALAIESGTGTKKILLRGFLRNTSWSWTVGAPIYVSTTSGALTQTIPSGSGEVVQIVGYAWATDIIHFTPGDRSTVEIA